MESFPNDLLESLRKSGWYAGRKIGKGGGAVVYLCFKISLIDSLKKFMTQSGTSILPQGQLKEDFCISLFDSIYHGILLPSDAVGAVKVPKALTEQVEKERMKREIVALKAITHPSLIKLYTHEQADTPRWFAMEYHHRGALNDHVISYKGKALQTIQAITGVAESMALLHSHSSGYVHRDIKPKNIFVSASGALVLGDLGIVFPNEDDGDRLTLPGTSEIFSRDWVPDWVRFRELDRYGPKMDVFMLAKVIYYMVSGGRNVPASQLTDEFFDLRKQFPGAEDIDALYDLLKRCITTRESECEPKNGFEMLQSLNSLAESLGSKSGLQLIFNFFSPHSTSHLPIPMTGWKGRKEITSTVVFIRQGTRRIKARANIETRVERTDVELQFRLESHSHLSESTVAIPIIIAQGPDLWTNTMELISDVPLKEGWYKLSIHGQANQSDASITAFPVYAE
jgi:serine/threonine protein kinase